MRSASSAAERQSARGGWHRLRRLPRPYFLGPLGAEAPFLPRRPWGRQLWRSVLLCRGWVFCVPVEAAGPAHRGAGRGRAGSPAVNGRRAAWERARATRRLVTVRWGRPAGSAWAGAERTLRLEHRPAAAPTSWRYPVSRLGEPSPPRNGWLSSRPEAQPRAENCRRGGAAGRAAGPCGAPGTASAVAGEALGGNRRGSAHLSFTHEVLAGLGGVGTAYSTVLSAVFRSKPHSQLACFLYQWLSFPHR